VRGRLIVLEGLDGTGKTTLGRALADRLGAAWSATPPAALREMRGAVDLAYARSPVAAQLFYAATVVGVSDEARQIMLRGQDVVCDRYWLSTLVYAHHRAHHVDLSAVEPLLVPADATLLVELDEPVRRARLRARGLSVLDRMTLEPALARSLRDSFRAALEHPVAGRGLRLDITGLNERAALEAALEALGPVRATARRLHVVGWRAA
jgi:thymidylate kinase